MAFKFQKLFDELGIKFKNPEFYGVAYELAGIIGYLQAFDEENGDLGEEFNREFENLTDYKTERFFEYIAEVCEDLKAEQNKDKEENEDE